jgi:ABC-type Fe3+/spermidine/putrescine transport system ATPase subunit
VPAIRLKGLRKSYGDIRAADGLDLEVRDGEYLCLLGPTGAGKTTVLRLVCGLAVPDEGTVEIGGREVQAWEPERRGAVMLSQSYSLFPQLTVAENILFGPEIRGMADDHQDQILTDMLDLVRLSKRPDAYPRELSGGMQQRTALARALASGAEILLLDEPLRALDARLRISLRHELRSLAKDLGLTVIHVTHDQDEALVMADRIALIRHGRVLQTGTPREVFDHPSSPFVANFVGQSNFFTGELIRRDGRTEFRMDGGQALDVDGRGLPDGPALLGVKVGNTDVGKDENGLPGKVERIIFEGRNLHVDVDCGAAGRVSAKVPSWRIGKVAVGEAVRVRWMREHARVFSMPASGLGEELKVE